MEYIYIIGLKVLMGKAFFFWIFNTFFIFLTTNE